MRERDAAELDEAYQLRALLEAHAASRAATRIGPDGLRALAESCDRFQQLCDGNTSNIRDLVEENLAFHTVIIEAAGSALLATTLRRLTDTPLIYKLYVWYSPEQRRIALHYHRQILKALESKDAERAALVMREHVLEPREHVLAHIGASPQP